MSVDEIDGSSDIRCFVEGHEELLTPPPPPELEKHRIRVSTLSEKRFTLSIARDVFIECSLLQRIQQAFHVRMMAVM